MQIRPTASASGLIINFSIALFHVYTEFGIDSQTIVFNTLAELVYWTIKNRRNIQLSVFCFDFSNVCVKLLRTGF